MLSDRELRHILNDPKLFYNTGGPPNLTRHGADALDRYLASACWASWQKIPNVMKIEDLCKQVTGEMYQVMTQRYTFDWRNNEEAIRSFQRLAYCASNDLIQHFINYASDIDKDTTLVISRVSAYLHRDAYSFDFMCWADVVVVKEPICAISKQESALNNIVKE